MPTFYKTIPAVFFNAFAAGIGYGGWAVYANYEHGAHAWIMAGSIQGIYAFISTLFITQVAQKTCVKYQYGLKGITIGFIVSFLVMLTIPLFIHNLFGTPNIWMTILPGLIWGSIYLLGFLITLDTTQRRKANSKI